MHPGLQVALRPRGRERKGPGQGQGPAVAEGLQPSQLSGRPCRCGNLFIQDRGQAQGHLLCQERRQGIFYRP